MTNRMCLVVLAIGVLLVVAVVTCCLSLTSGSDVGKVSAAASAAAAVAGLLAFVVLVIYTAETRSLRIAANKQLQLQRRVQEDQVRLSLFDKRFVVYLVLRRFLIGCPS